MSDESNGFLTNIFTLTGNTLEGFYSRNTYEMWKLLIDLIKSGKFILPVADVETASFVNLQATGVEQITDSDNRYGTSELHIHLALKFNLFKKKTYV